MNNDIESKETTIAPEHSKLTEAKTLDDLCKALTIWAARSTYDLLTDLFKQGLITREEYEKVALETVGKAIENLK